MANQQYFSNKQLIQFRAIFDRFDKNSDGALSLSEFKDAMKILELDHLTDAELQVMVRYNNTFN